MTDSYPPWVGLLIGVAAGSLCWACLGLLIWWLA